MDWVFLLAGGIFVACISEYICKLKTNIGIQEKTISRLKTRLELALYLIEKLDKQEVI